MALILLITREGEVLEIVFFSSFKADEGMLLHKRKGSGW